MNRFLTVVAICAAATLGSATANAKGCIKGAIVGGIAGHYLGHHGTAGAAAGCVIGHHEAAKRDRAKREQTTGAAPGTR